MAEEPRVEGEIRPTGDTPAVVSSRFLRWSEVLYVLVNLPFLFFFYDAFNLNDSIYSTSFLYLGLNPYDPAHGATIIAGYPLLSYNLGMLGAYGGTTFDILFTAVLLKLLALGATYLAARILLRIAVRERVANWKALYLTFLFNPFILFVNVVWMETDIFVMLAILIGFYFIYYGWDRSYDLLALVAGATAVLWAVFSYYSPILLIPAVIVYCASRKQQTTTLLTFVVVGVVLAIPLVAFQLSSFAVLGLTAGGRTNPYSLIELWVPLGATLPTLTSRAVLAMVGLASVIIPLVLRRRQVPLAVCLLVVYSFALVSTPTLVQGDNFVILAGLIPLALAFVRGVKITWIRILALELFLIPLMWIVEMFNGPGQVTGVYYWAFFALHQNVDLYQPLGGALAWRVCLVLSAVLLAGAVVYVLWRDMATRRDIREVVADSAPARTENRGFGWHGPGSNRRIVGVCAVAILVALPALGWASTQGGFSIDASGEFPSQLFVVHDFDAPTTYLQPASNTFAVSPSSGTLDFGPASPSIGFERPLQNQVFDLGYSVHVSDPGAIGIGFPIVVTNASGLETGFSTEVSTPTNLTPLAPVQGEGFTSLENPSGILSNVSASLRTNGTGFYVYPVVPAKMAGMSVVFAGEMSRYASSQNVLWSISNNGTIVLESYMVGQSFFLGSFAHSTWTTEGVGTLVFPGSWFYSGFSVDPTGHSLTSWLNGYSLTAPGAWNLSGHQFLNFGKFSQSPAYNGTFAFIGNLTGLYVLPTASISFASGGFLDSMRTPTGVLSLSGSTLEVDYTGSPPESTLRVNGHAFSVNSSQPQIQLGKIGDASVGIQFAFEHVDLSSVNPSSGLIWVVLEFAVSLPLAPFVLYAARSFPLDRRIPRPPADVGPRNV
ncbi:MAG: hypothetical protein ABSA63_08305 [Thermoplasmata archaeon]